MTTIADKKIHFAPLERHEKAIRRLIAEGRYSNVTEIMRAALDHYLDRIGRPTLSEQARQMADDDAREGDARTRGAVRLQEPSMASDETW